MKKYLHWPYLVIIGFILLVLLIPTWLAMSYIAIVRVLIELFDRGEWWLLGWKKSRSFNNPWNYKLSRALKSAFIYER